jgi:KaiC/GvpD/RAD55 family RecA-like ATPase
MTGNRLCTGVSGLDKQLGGGYVPGTLTVIVGATGIGKTQLGLQFAHAADRQRERRGIVLDVSARGDSQNHARYAEQLFEWKLNQVNPGDKPRLNDFYAQDRVHGDYLHVFDYHGRRVTRHDLEWEEWRAWQAELNAKLQTTIGFLYGNFVQKCRRLVVDGVEPCDRPQESIQLNLFEYVYHQIVRKDPAWVARDLFREHYREQAEQAEQHRYDPAAIGCLLLYTSHEMMLDDLISRPLDEGDALSNANTLIYLGKVREGTRILRGMYVAKHRGSPCSDEIIPYTIDDQGLRLI